MEHRVYVLALLLASCAPALRMEPPAPPTRQEALTMDELFGTWVYAADPAGVIASDRLYEGSTLTLGADGQYLFRLRGPGMVLEGRWTLVDTEGETVRIATDYGRDRTNLLTLTAQRGVGGDVVGFVIREGDGTVGVRYYRRSP